jgi:DNA modification methylase
MKFPDDYINKIICGDALKILPDFPPKSVDMIFTSPPFKDEDVQGDYWKFYDKFFNLAIQITKKVLIIIHSSTKMNYIISHYPPKRTMIWGKGFSQYSYRYNPIFVYQLDDNYKVNKYIWNDCFGISSLPPGKSKWHRYQDPLILYETIIKMFKDCNLVLDPFIGSGTTALACKNLGKNFIGIEINPEICKNTKSNLGLDND